MAGSTITGSIGGVNVAVNSSTGIQRGLTAQLLNSAATANAFAFATVSGSLTSKAVAVSGSGSLVSGATSVPSAVVLLNGQFDTYINNGTTLSTVIAADNSNSTVINMNPYGALVAATGAGANVLAGFVEANQFITGEGGQDSVYLAGAKNTLSSSGADAVLVGGPSTVTAFASAIDNIVMSKATTLAFVNGSQTSAMDSITGAANATISVAGTGNTSVTGGSGPESFFVDTASGNVTLGGEMQPNNVFTFVADGLVGSNQTTVLNFAASDGLHLHGYTNYYVSNLAGTTGGSVLSLSDGSKVTFTNASSAVIAAAVKLS